MDARENKTLSELVTLVKSWIPWRSEPAHVSRDFWMPDQSCRVCYDCDSQFTIFNRRHHCRLCGRVFCGKCTANSIPASFADSRSPPEECEKIRVCSYCFKQWKDGIATPDNSIPVANRDISTSPSVDSIVSTKSTGTVNGESFTLGSMPCLSGPYQRVQYSSGISSHQPSVLETSTYGQGKLTSRKSSDLKADMGDHPHRLNRNDNDTDDYGIYQTDSETRRFPPINYYSQAEFDEMSNDDGSQKLHPDVEYVDAKSLSSSPLFQDSFNSPCLEEIQQPAKKDENDIGDECEAPSSLYAAEDVDAEPVDFENNGLLWLPPEPEDEEDEREDALFDDDDGGEEAAGEWGYQRTSSFGSGEYRNKDKSSEEHKKAMKNVVDGHFRALVSQLLQVENLPVGDEDGQGSWLEIITSLSWEAAHLLKPDTSTGGGMDPGGYVKVKCIASGRRSDSMVLKGVVCKKNVAHRRMTSKIEKPRLLILGGALEYQRVSNLLSSFDTLLQQEMDHLKMAVAKIAAHHPNILLVEKSVSRFAQEYLLAKDISLALNIKRPLLERIARCTGAQIVPSIDHLSSQKLGYCENFHVERFVEDLGAAGQGGKKLVKTLMYFEGCPKPFGCTILLRGANGDELKKVKHVVQYGVFAAYHLALETSFLADEGASLPELPFNSPITVALPDKPSSIERSISTVPGFSVPTNEKSSGPQPIGEPLRSNSVPTADLPSSIRSALDRKMEMIQTPCLSNGCSLQMVQTASSFTNAASPVSSAPSEEAVSIDKMLSPGHLSKEKNETSSTSSEHMVVDASIANNFVAVKDDGTTVHDFGPLEAVGQGGAAGSSGNDHNTMIRNQPGAYGVSSMQQDNNNNLKEPATLKEEFPPSPNDHQSILVSLSSRCVWKGTICERSHLFRIKYYGSFDKPLGRFLRDHLFDQSYRCRSCEMPSEAHVHCYTHRQGTLTISVKRLPEILLPGEREGKIWMWHRCLRCPRVNGFPPATRRVVMSDAAWGLSFGKFLELSFSNHAAASRVACCGHSLHRDCLRFYGFGKMVACFLYATIDVHSVYLPPPKLDFSSENQEWIQKESDEVVEQAELLFSEVLNSLSQITAEGLRVGPLSSGIKTSESRHRVAELERLLQREKADFEEDVQKVVNREVKKGQPVIDILEINRLRRQLLFQSYVWDQRLNNAASLDNKRPQNGFGSASPEQGKPLVKSEKILDLNVADSHKEGHHSSDSFLVDPKLHKSPDHEELGENTNQLDAVHEEDISVGDSNHEKEDQAEFSSHSSISYQSDPLGSRKDVYRALSDGQIPVLTNLSDSLDAAWTGESHPRTRFPKDNSSAFPDSAVTDSLTVTILSERLDMENTLEGHDGPKLSRSVSPALPTKSFENLEDSVIRLGLPFWNLYRSINKNFLASSQKLNTPGHYHPVYISSFRESQLQGGARLLLPLGVDDIVVPVYDDEPTSIIAYALASPQYHLQLSDEGERPKDSGDSVASLPSDAIHNQTHSVDETTISSYRSLGSTDDSILSTYGSHSLLVSDPLSYTKAFHARVTLEDDGPLGKVNFSVTCYYAMRFEALRRICCTSELDYIRSLSRCKKWGAQGGKSNVFFAKTLDDRFIIKQVTKTELESFIKFAPAYFKYLSESVSTKSPTCLAKILGIYQVTAKHLKGGKESKMDVLVMENLLFGRSVMRLYDLKGSSRSRYNPDSSGSNKVLLDQNLIESMPTSPIFVGNKAKRLLERAVWNDTAFLASVDVMDYSLLVGVDEEKHELVLGIIDFMRQYTWDKHLETWVKASGILGGPKNASPTVISPKQYKKRFRKAMTMYFLMVPDQWSTPYTIPSKCPSDICEDSSQGGTTVE